MELAAEAGGRVSPQPKKAPAKPASNSLEAAMVAEAEIAAEAATIRGDAKALDAELFMRLWPLLRRPIPQHFIVSTGVTKGKPYASTGVKSLQVLIDRMDAVLTPLWWGYKVDYIGPEGLDDRGRPRQGTLARATVIVGVGANEQPLLARVSYGGVDQASTVGNLFKASETNAAKRAFAQVGPGHEVYIGATDFDPDTDEDAAKIQEAPAPAIESLKTISGEDVARLVDLASGLGLADDAALKQKAKTKLGSMGVTMAGSISATIATLTPAQGADFEGWLSDLADVKEAKS